VATSTMEITDFVWPNMTDADKAAVAAFRAALLAHEEGHFATVEAALATLPKTISATGATGKAAVKALQAKVTTQIADSQKAIDKAKTDYDTTTKNGKNQAAVGGTNVTLTCPVPGP
jgi:predicted secreted Zn-dependent protease